MALDGCQRRGKPEGLEPGTDLLVAQLVTFVGEDGQSQIVQAGNDKLVGLLKTQLGGDLGECISHGWWLVTVFFDQVGDKHFVLITSNHSCFKLNECL